MSTTAAEVPSSVEAFRVIPNGAPHSDEERADALADLRFGVQFTDHMARITWTDGEGWHDRRVEAYGPLQLDPAAADPLRPAGDEQLNVLAGVGVEGR